MSTPRHPSTPAAAGFSLVELLIAAGIMLIILVGILPLFMRAISANAYGGDASTLASFMNSGLEQFNQISANNNNLNSILQDPNAGGGGGGGEGESGGAAGAGGAGGFGSGDSVRVLPKQLYDTGSRSPFGDQVMGDEEWIAIDDSEVGLLMWERQIEVRNYGFADVHSGTIKVDAADAAASLFQVGHPKLFDNPLPFSANTKAEIREFRIAVDSIKEAHPVGHGQHMVVGHYRAF